MCISSSSTTASMSRITWASVASYTVGSRCRSRGGNRDHNLLNCQGHSLEHVDPTQARIGRSHPPAAGGLESPVECIKFTRGWPGAGFAGRVTRTWISFAYTVAGVRPGPGPRSIVPSGGRSSTGAWCLGWSVDRAPSRRAQAASRALRPRRGWHTVTVELPLKVCPDSTRTHHRGAVAVINDPRHRPQLHQVVVSTTSQMRVTSWFVCSRVRRRMTATADAMRRCGNRRHAADVLISDIGCLSRWLLAARQVRALASMVTASSGRAHGFART